MAEIVFHYCANELKNELLFSDDENGHDNYVGNEGYQNDDGAKYLTLTFSDQRISYNFH